VTLVTKEQLQKALPPTLKQAATDALANKINSITADPIVAEQIRENFIGYISVLKDGRFKTEDYLNAVAYVSYKLMDYSNREAYERTFPARYAALVAAGTPPKEIAAYVSQYNKGKLVNLILEQSLTPTWVLNQDIYQKAINQQAYLMMNAGSELVQTQAANSLLTHLKKPEGKDFQVKIDIPENSGMKEMKDALEKMARQQQELINAGVTTKQIASTPIIEAEGIDVGTSKTIP